MGKKQLRRVWNFDATTLSSIVLEPQVSSLIAKLAILYCGITDDNKMVEIYSGDDDRMMKRLVSIFIKLIN